MGEKRRVGGEREGERTITIHHGVKVNFIHRNTIHKSQITQRTTHHIHITQIITKKTIFCIPKRIRFYFINITMTVLTFCDSSKDQRSILNSSNTTTNTKKNSINPATTYSPLTLPPSTLLPYTTQPLPPQTPIQFLRNFAFLEGPFLPPRSFHPPPQTHNHPSPSHPLPLPPLFPPHFSNPFLASLHLSSKTKPPPYHVHPHPSSSP